MVDWLNCLPLEYKLKQKDMKVKIAQFGNTRETDVGERTFWFKTKTGNKFDSSSSLNQDFYLRWLEELDPKRLQDDRNDIFEFKTAITL